MILLSWRTDWAHWFDLKNKCCAHGMACFEHYWKVLFTCEQWMPHASFSIGLLSRVLPLWPLGHQAARYGAHLSPSLRAPARHQTHLDSITSLYTVCHSLWLLPQASLFLFHVCVLLVFLVLYYVLFILLKHSLPELAFIHSAHSLQYTYEMSNAKYVNIIKVWHWVL